MATMQSDVGLDCSGWIAQIARKKVEYIYEEEKTSRIKCIIKRHGPYATSWSKGSRFVCFISRQSWINGHGIFMYSLAFFSMLLI